MKIAVITTDSREHFKDYHTPLPYFGTAPEALLQGFAKMPEHEIHVISCVKKPVAPTPKIADNIFYHSIVVPGAWSLSLYATCSRPTRAKLREIKPDIVHGQGTEKDCALSAQRSGFPNLITIHGNIREIGKIINAPFFSYFTIQSFLETWAIRRTAGVICLTNYTLKSVQRDARKTWVLPNAVNETFFDIKRASQINNNILCVANIQPRKNQNFLIRALDPVAQANNLRVVFLGSGNPIDPYFQEFQQFIKTRPWCVYEGFKRGAPLEEHLKSARLLILPSLEENCPMSILEANAIGLPVAAANAGGIPDLIDSGVNGLMFDPQNAESIRNAVLKLFNDRAFSEKVVAAAHRRVRERHHPLAIAKRHIEIYEEVLSHRH